MGTRSTIALEFADGTVQSVYCHWDGYLSNNGVILRDHWSDPFKLQKLIDLGNLSSLGTELGNKHDFDERTFTCNFYGRDRGDTTFVDAEKFDNFHQYVEENNHQGFDYILRRIDGKPVWFVRTYKDELFVTLDEVIATQGMFAEI